MKVTATSCIELASVDLLDPLVQLLDISQQCLIACKHNKVETPKWLAALLLVLDIYQKISVSNKRKMTLKKIIVSN